MTTIFERAFAHSMRFEGGFADDPADPGLATNHGLSLRFLRTANLIERFDHNGDGDLDAYEVGRITREQARDVYQEYFWEQFFDALAPNIAIKLFDFGVNVGPKQRTIFAQRAFNESSYEIEGLWVDGILGSRTRLALTKLNDASGPSFLDDLESNAARFYYDLAERRRKSRAFLFGWLRRCYARP